MIERIAKLLAQAERTANQTEAETFFAKAQALASRHAIDLAVARAHTARTEQREEPVVRTIVVGERGRHANASLVQLFNALALANAVRINVASNSTRVYAFGMPSDIDMVERLWVTISGSMVRFGNDYIKRGEWRTEDMWSPRKNLYVPMTAQSARRSFYDGFIRRVYERAMEEKQQAEAAATAETAKVTGPDGLPISTALVLRNKEVEVADFYKQRSNARGSWRGDRTAGGRSWRAEVAGRAAADRATLHPQHAIGA